VATTEVRQFRPPVFLLPATLFVVLFGIAVLMAQFAPSQVTSGVYQVFVGDGAAVIPTEDLTCSRTADTATCTTRVNGRQLTIDVLYTGEPDFGRCAARYGDREVSCYPAMGFYGHTSQTVWITEDLGLSRTQLADLDAAAPWWRVTNELTTAMLALTGALGVAAGVATCLLRRRFRPVTPHRRLPLVVGTAVLASVFFAATSVLFAPPGSGAAPLLMLSPLSLLASAMMAAWQWQLSGTRGGRVVSAVVATVTVAFYTGVSMLVFLIQSGFDD
jgi:hypothetical protein